MYGLPDDVDLAFLEGAKLLQICVGENEIILNLHPSISILIASKVLIAGPDSKQIVCDKASETAKELFPVLGQSVVRSAAVSPGTLRLELTSDYTVQIQDSWREFESYTITYGDKVIVV